MKKYIKFLIILCFLFCPFSNFVFADDGFVCEHGFHTFSDKQMNYGVGQYGNNRRYYYTVGFDSSFNSFIDRAVDEWVHTSQNYPYVRTSISIRKTNVKSNALFEFHNKDCGYGCLGETHFYMYSREIHPNNNTLPSDYGWAKIYLSVNEMNASNISNLQKIGTSAHELGHAMGLSHQNSRQQSIMCQTSYGRVASRADAIDCNTINHIYG